MTTRRPLSTDLRLLIFALLLAFVLPRGASAEDEVVAWLAGEPITRADVGPDVAFRVWRHEVDIYSVLRDATESLVDERLLAAEAERRGVSPDALVAEAEAAGSGEPVTDAEIDAYLKEHPRESAAAATAARPRIRHFLEERRRIEGRLALITRLREQAKYRFVLARPQQPRARIDTAGRPARGPDEAAIELVHFATFSARDSARSARRIARLREQFPEAIRQVHLSFLGERDEVGLLAAQLATVAQEREVFWPLHDALFAAGGRLGAEDVRRIAGEQGLDVDTVSRAASDPKRLDAVRREIGAALTLGIPRAPALLVNGRYVSGLVPYDELVEIVREELDALRQE